jgi:hypothetical protein
MILFSNFSSGAEFESFQPSVTQLLSENYRRAQSMEMTFRLHFSEPPIPIMLRQLCVKTPSKSQTRLPPTPLLPARAD